MNLEKIDDDIQNFPLDIRTIKYTLDYWLSAFIKIKTEPTQKIIYIHN